MQIKNNIIILTQIIISAQFCTQHRLDSNSTITMQQPTNRDTINISLGRVVKLLTSLKKIKSLRKLTKFAKTFWKLILSWCLNVSYTYLKHHWLVQNYLKNGSWRMSHNSINRSLQTSQKIIALSLSYRHYMQIDKACRSPSSTHCLGQNTLYPTTQFQKEATLRYVTACNLL